MKKNDNQYQSGQTNFLILVQKKNTTVGKQNWKNHRETPQEEEKQIMTGH
jgi:hypothetical protein